MPTVFTTKPTRASRRNAPSRSAAGAANTPKRAQIVWTSFVFAMTLACGGLYALNGAPKTRLEGLALPALLAPGGTSSVEAVFATRKPLDRARWQAVVIHHSGAPTGKPDLLDQAARTQGLKELGYHFVIGNGNGMADGELFVGRRWRDQVPGAHVGGKDGDWYNQRAIGICLVGDGDRGRPTEAQLQRLTELTASLCRRLGIPPGHVYMHSELAPTTSPGRLFPGSTFRDQVTSHL
jgi:hypothetical protein